MYQHLKELNMPDRPISIYDFYEEKLKFKKHFYIYATFQQGIKLYTLCPSGIFAVL